MTAFDAMGFLDVARVLAEPRDDWPPEARARTSVGRAYYSAHLVAVEAVRRKWPAWVPSGTGDDHGRVIRELNLHKTRRIADRLAALRLRREHADYHSGASELRMNAKRSPATKKWRASAGGMEGAGGLCPTEGRDGPSLPIAW